MGLTKRPYTAFLNNVIPRIRKLVNERICDVFSCSIKAISLFDIKMIKKCYLPLRYIKKTIRQSVVTYFVIKMNALIIKEGGMVVTFPSILAAFFQS